MKFNKTQKYFQRRSLLLVLLLVFVFSSCTATGQSIQSEATELPGKNTATVEITNTFTPEPTATITPTLAPTPMGGTKLRVAYYSQDCEAIKTENCIAIADFFNESVYYRIPLNDATTETKLSWSPDGRYLLYEDKNDSRVNFDVMLYDFVLTQSTLLKSYPIEMPPSQSYYNGELVLGRYTDDNSLGKSKWSADGKYVVYRTFLDTVNDRINVYSLETGENTLVDGFIWSYYWLDDDKSIIEIKTGQLYNAETKELMTIPNAYFMNVDTFFDYYIVSYKGDNPSKADEIYFYPYVTDRAALLENGTEMLYDSEFLFAKFDYEEEKRKPSINLNALFIQGNSVIFSGTAYLYEPFEIYSYQYTGKMSDIPFNLTLEDFPDEGYDNNSVMISISPDEKFYLMQQIFFIDNNTKQSIITINDMETGEELDTFDFHELGEEMHEIDYTGEKNLAFYWEE